MQAEKRSRGIRAMAAGLVGVPFIWALLANLSLFRRISQVIEKPTFGSEGAATSWSSIFPFHDADFSTAFWEVARSCLVPTRAAHLLGSGGLWLLVGTSVLVLWYWSMVLRSKDSSPTMLLPALAPALLGLVLFPAAILHAFQLLADMGVSLSAAHGAGLGETVSAPYLGGLLSLLLLIIMWLSRRRLTSRETAAVDHDP